MRVSGLINAIIACCSSAYAAPTHGPPAFATTSTLMERGNAPSEPEGSVLSIPDHPPPSTPAKIEPVDLKFGSKFQWQIYKSCPDDHRRIINEAWADSKDLSDALASYKSKADFQPAIDMYMGDRSTYTNFLIEPPYDFPTQIRSETSLLLE